jgi:L-threonylcarbamoyladenylate synthase
LRVVTVDPAHPREERLADAVETLRSCGVVALPTETFYGLGADCGDSAALRKLNELKRKEQDSPILLLASDREQVVEVAASLPDYFEELARSFWPGPLTLVLPVADSLPDEISGGRGTVAIRVPGLALPRSLARALGRPVTGISANIHGQPPCRTAGEVAAAFGDGIAMILDGGSTQGGAPSTILDLTAERPKLLREGVLPAFSLHPFLPHPIDPTDS